MVELFIRNNAVLRINNNEIILIILYAISLENFEGKKIIEYLHVWLNFCIDNKRIYLGTIKLYIYYINTTSSMRNWLILCMLSVCAFFESETAKRITFIPLHSGTDLTCDSPPLNWKRAKFLSSNVAITCKKEFYFWTQINRTKNCFNVFPVGILIFLKFLSISILCFIPSIFYSPSTYFSKIFSILILCFILLIFHSISRKHFEGHFSEEPFSDNIQWI